MRSKPLSTDRERWESDLKRELDPASGLALITI